LMSRGLLVIEMKGYACPLLPPPYAMSLISK